MDQQERDEQAAQLQLEAAELYREIARRLDASQSLLPFCEYVEDLFLNSAHLQLVQG